MWLSLRIDDHHFFLHLPMDDYGPTNQQTLNTGNGPACPVQKKTSTMTNSETKDFTVQENRTSGLHCEGLICHSTAQGCSRNYLSHWKTDHEIALHDWKTSERNKKALSCTESMKGPWIIHIF
jgi:hypothetical protein